MNVLAWFRRFPLQVELADAHKANRVLRRANDRLQGERDEARAQYRDLLRMYHELRMNGADTVPPITMPQEAFGPLTRAALADASIGQSGVVIRAMRRKAESIWIENRNDENCDKLVAIAVRDGEVAR